MARKVGIALGIAGALVVGLIVLVAVAAPSGSVTTDSDGNHFIELAMISVQVAEPDPILEIPDQFLGVPHAPPEFDTTDLGPDLGFSQDPSTLRPLDSDEVLRAVYLGHDVNGDPYYIWHTGSPNFRQLLGQVLADLGSFGRFATSYGSLMTGGGLFDNSVAESIAQHGLMTGSLSQTSGEPAILTAEWHALPDEVAVVVFYEDGEPLGWQGPVSGTVAVQRTYDEDIETFGRKVEMVALTAAGDEWNRFVIFD